MRLREIHMEMDLQPIEPEILELKHHDYPYRIVVTKQSWVTLVAHLASDIDYSNFKNAVTSKAATRAEGDARHGLYMRVWSAMHGAEKWLMDRVKIANMQDKGQGSFGFWMGSQTARDPRSDSDVQETYEPDRGRNGWVGGESGPDRVIDNPTPEDIARLEAELDRRPRRRREGR